MILATGHPLTEEHIARVTPHNFGAWASGGKFIPYRHIEYIGERIARAVFQGGGRLIVNMPPGHGKSSLLSLWTPTWFLDNLPSRRVIVAGHGAELAAHWGRMVRNEFEGNQNLRTKLSEDSTAANRWNTDKGGGMVTCGVGSGITGFRANLTLIDDPHPTWQEAHSPTHRKRVVEWFTGTLADRQEPGATIVLLMHRWHDEDLAGWLISNHPDRWQVIRLPALAEAGDPMGRESGEALCPERYDATALKQARTEVGAAVWDAKYQQDPQLAGSGRAYRNYVPATHEDKGLRLRSGIPLHLSWDFNVNPGVHCILGQYDSHRDLFTAVHEVHGPRMKTRAAMQAVRKLVGEIGGFAQFCEVHVFGDRSGRTENTTTDATDYQIIAQELTAAGAKVRMRVQTNNPPIKRRMTSFNEALSDADGDVHYKVNPLNCPRLVNDLKNVKEDEDGLIDKSNADLTHPSDAQGYWITYLRPVVEQRLSTSAARPSTVPQPA